MEEPKKHQSWGWDGVFLHQEIQVMDAVAHGENLVSPNSIQASHGEKQLPLKMLFFTKNEGKGKIKIKPEKKN